MTQQTNTSSTDTNNTLNTSSQVIIRPARANDVPKIFDNIGYWASQGKCWFALCHKFLKT